MKLTGIIEDVFQGFTLFRGYAKLRHLASISKVTDYQREVNEGRLKEITDFLSNSPFGFFPEIMLGFQLEDANAIQKIKNELNTGSFTTSDGIKVKKSKFKFTAPTDEPITKVMSFEFSEEVLASKPFSRIDGNHRLNAIDIILSQEQESGVVNKIADCIVPFSILVQTESEEAAKYETALFYLINSHALPLTTEENLRAIFSETKISNVEMQQLLGLTESEINLIRSISTFLKEMQFSYISDLFYAEIYTFAFNLVKLLSNVNISTIYTALVYLETLYKENKNNEEKKTITTQGIALAFAKLFIDEPKEKDKFLKWVRATNIKDISQISAEKLLDIYHNFTKKQTFNVFVAMPYISHKHVTDYNKLFEEVLDDISKDMIVSLKLIPIMRFRGSSQRIDQRLIKCIKECDIFIADLTLNNDNVIFEIGLAEGNNKPMILIRAEEDSKKTLFEETRKDINEVQVPFDMDKLQWIPYSSTGYYNDIKGIIRRNIKIILEEVYQVV